jgi:hypothetical protein
MIASYYFWKWADNDVPGCPEEVHAELLRGKLHPAIESFDPAKLIKQLDKGAARGRQSDEEWSWQVIPSTQAGLASAVFATAVLPDGIRPHKIQMSRVLWPFLLKHRIAMHGEDSPLAGPDLKHNHIYSGQGLSRYDIQPQEVRALLLTLRRTQADPFLILGDPKGDYVQCYLEKRRRYVLEWRQYHVPLWNDSRISNYEHWRRVDQQRKAALPPQLRHPKAKVPEDQDPDLVTFALVVEAFEAFVRGEPIPRLEHWRSIKEEIL